MKLAFLLLYIAATNCVLSQNDSIHGVDSAANREWMITSSYTYSTELVFTRREYELVKSDMLTLLKCDDSSLVLQLKPYVPPLCQEKYLNDQKVMDYNSAGKLYYNCIDEHYNNPKNILNKDTLYIIDDYVPKTGPGTTNQDVYFMTKMEIYTGDDSFHLISEFYTIDELKNICLQEGQFRKKNIESWTNGRKDGEWKYYDKTGKLIKLLIYDMGMLKKETSY